MRIAYVGPLFPHTGGSGTSAGQLLAGIAGAGHAVCAIAPITARSFEGGDWFAARHPELTVVRYFLDEFYTRGFLPPSEEFLANERSLIRNLLHELTPAFRPDFILAGREMMARYIPTIAEELHLPFIQMVRGSPTGNILDGTYEYEEDTELVLGAMARAASVITVSDYFTDGLRRLGLSQAVTVPNAIDTKAFSPGSADSSLRRELQIVEDDIVILTAANFHGRKRPLDIVRSASLALEEDRRLLYVMCGVGVLENDVRELCREMNIKDRFRFPGWIRYDRMPALTRLADIAIIASDVEGMARSYLEAMACGCVLIASEIPASRELLEDGVTGLLYPMGDVERLATRTLEAASNPELRASIGRRARDHVLSRSIDAAVEAYVGEFEHVLSGKMTRSAGAVESV